MEGKKINSDDYMPKLQQMASILQTSQSLQRWRKQLAKECAAILPVHKGIHYKCKAFLQPVVVSHISPEKGDLLCANYFH